MAYFSEQQLPRYREDDMPGTVKKLYNFCRELQEMLQFVLSNLDADNIEGYEEIFNRLTDGEGNISILKQTAQEILMQVRNNEGQIGELSVRADGITARVQDNEKGLAQLKITAGEISSQVADNKKNISSVTQTAKEIASRVTDAETNISTVTQTAKSISSRVSTAEGKISTVTQTADKVAAIIAGTNGSITNITATANGLTSTVSDLSGKYSKLEQTVNGFNFNGVVTFDNLSADYDRDDNPTIINGDLITTGTIDAERLLLYGPMEVYESRSARSLAGYIGFVNGKAYNDNGSLRSTEGIGVKAPSTNREYEGGMVVCTDSGARLTFGPDMFGSTTTIACVSEHCYSSEPMETFSDLRLKQDVNYDIAEKYGAFYRALRPCRFIMKRDTRGAFQIGFIAQDVKQALGRSGLALSDFAALTQFRSEDPAEEGTYALRYGEFAALNTAMVQSLLDRVDALEAEVERLKGGHDGI